MIFISTPELILNFFNIVLTTRPAVFFAGFVGIGSFEIILIPFSFFFESFTSSKNASNASPNTSNPGPKFAVDEGALTVTLFTN